MNKQLDTLTNDQKNALVELNKWLQRKDDYFFTLCGAAGTGKTYLMKLFLDKYVKKSICVTAPTHKAVRVIEKHTGRKGKTIQALHGLRPNFDLENFNTDNIKFDTIGIEQIQNYGFIAEDECSMVNQPQYDLNAARAKSYKVKILYIGDPLQLPPIIKGKNQQHKVSPTFTSNTVFELKQVVRQKDNNPLMELFPILRTDIINGTSEFVKLLKAKPFNINNDKDGYVCLKGLQFKTALLKRFKEGRHLTDLNYIKYTAFRNETISNWNGFIRNHLIQDKDVLVSKQDILLGYTTILDQTNFLKNVLTNSTDYKILDITTRQSEEGFDVYLLRITDGVDESIISVINNKSHTFRKFYARLNQLHYNAVYSNPQQRGKNWSNYYNFKNKFLIMKPITFTDGGERRGVAPKDLDYGYGMTVHKLQGSTVENIYVNMIDIMYHKGDLRYPIVNTRQNPDAVQYRNKLIYTAISRASKKAVLLMPNT